MASVYQKRATWYVAIKDATGKWRKQATKALTCNTRRRRSSSGQASTPTACSASSGTATYGRRPPSTATWTWSACGTPWRRFQARQRPSPAQSVPTVARAVAGAGSVQRSAAGASALAPNAFAARFPPGFYPTRIAAMPKGRASGFPLDFPALQNGRCRFRTCDPSRVKAVLYR